MQDVGFEDARIRVDWLLQHVLELSRTDVIARTEMEVSATLARQINRGLERLLAGVPIQHVVGWAEFYGLRLVVSSAVLIPRPETELVVDLVLELTEREPSCRVLDLGTGSGSIALAVKAGRPRAHVVAADVSPEALEVARINADRLGLDINLAIGDIESPWSIASLGRSFDVVVSNPPYIAAAEFDELPAEVAVHEPKLALVAGDDPLRFYRSLVARAKEVGRAGGWLITEVHADRGRHVARLFEEAGFADVGIRVDLAGHDRAVTGMMPTDDDVVTPTRG